MHLMVGYQMAKCDVEINVRPLALIIMAFVIYFYYNASIIPTIVRLWLHFPSWKVVLVEVHPHFPAGKCTQNLTMAAMVEML